MERWILSTPRWLLLAALVYAPWAYGSTRPWTITGLNWLLGGVIASWVLGQLLCQRWPRIHPVLLVATGLLIGQSWFMVFNASYDYDHVGHEFITLSPMFSWAPGSLDQERSSAAATRLSLLLLCGIVVSEMTEHSTWRKRFLGTMAIAGCSIAVLGLVQRFSAAPGIFWQPEGFGPNFFATFRNHTNAGAFLNLTWPLAMLWAMREKVKAGATWKFISWSVMSVVIVTGVIVNTSRAATALAVVLVFISGLWLLWQTLKGRLGNLAPSHLLVTGVLVLLVIGALAFMTGLDSNVVRWRQFNRQLTEDNSRLLAAEVCLKMIPESGWFGFGVGTFETAFPYFTAEFGDQLKGRWIYGHQDYLQTVTEWGYVGFACWATLIGGALAHSWRRRLKIGIGASHSARTTHFGILIALAGVFGHAMVDYPLQIASIQLYTVVLLGFLWSSRHWIRSDRHPVVARRAKIPVEAMATVP